MPTLRQQRTASLRSLLHVLLERSPFYQRKLADFSVVPESFELADLASLPFTTKAELSQDQERHPPYGTTFTEPLGRAVRVHRTSGTTGQPIRWLDSRDNWTAFLACWQRVFEAAGVTANDRVFVAFSFGPFIGFWGAFEAAQAMGALAISGGAQTTQQRLETLFVESASVLVCTPTYALHLARAAGEAGIDLTNSSVERLLCAGEPGASVPNIRRRLQDAFGAAVYDHAGATELGAWGYPSDHPKTEPTDMCINELHFVAEVIDDAGNVLYGPAGSDDGDSFEGELVLTSVSRLASPLLRYRTGDRVHLFPPTDTCPTERLHGGVLGRVDDMFVVRGVNVFPSAIENVVLGVDGVTEYQAVVRRGKGAEMTELQISVEVEPSPASPEAVVREVSRQLRAALGLRIDVHATTGLPRSELKSRRFHFEN